MLKILRVFTFLVIIFGVSGCTTYEIKKDTPLTMLDNNVEHGRTGRSKVFTASDDITYLLSDKDIYVKHKSCVKFNNVCYYNFSGVTTNLDDACFYELPQSSNCVEEFIKQKKIIREIKLVKVRETSQNTILNGLATLSHPIITDYYEGTAEDIGFMIAVNKARGLSEGGNLNIEYIDFTDRVALENAEFEKAKKIDSVESYKNYINNYPRSYKKNIAKKDLFWKMFDVKLLSSDKSQQRSFQRSGLTTSGAGACQDFTKQFEIVPKPSVTMDTDFDVSVKSVLNRKYSPINAGSESGPLVKVVPVSLSRSNNYRQSVNVDYECVPTSITVSNAILNGIAKLAGMFGQNVGKTTYTLTLSSTSFEVDVVDVK